MANQVSNLLNLSQASEAAGVTRKTLYSHIDKGLISVTNKNGKRFIDVSELIRHYGNVSLPVSKVNDVTQSQNKQDNDVYLAIQNMQKQIESLQKLVADQSDSMALLLEDKLARKSLEEELVELKKGNEEISTENKSIRDELSAVKSELEKEKKKSFLKRFFGVKS
ncbi:helix-turn-helix domain-containing protein [Rosenbergiella metrosideri]|uniref:helix-turn-helix domain-containing protein n=1 Tax=Rosenbergiella metrosideri TaxID=2921185 RepID=UPI001F4F6F5D|nr:hypothetical protein [Rosenbergiella metrosideri]